MVQNTIIVACQKAGISVITYFKRITEFITQQTTHFFQIFLINF